MRHEDIAQIAHEVNRAYCEALGDMTQPAWRDAPEQSKESVRLGVDLHLAHPFASPEDSHEVWLLQKESAGWIYGPVKDTKAKQHPNMVPLADLPRAEQAKDYIFRAVVHSLAPHFERSNPAVEAQEKKPNTPIDFRLRFK